MKKCGALRPLLSLTNLLQIVVGGLQERRTVLPLRPLRAQQVKHLGVDLGGSVTAAWQIDGDIHNK